MAKHSIRILRATALALALCGTAFAAPVTTEGTGVGKHGDVTVAVTFDGGKITAIDVKSSLENPILAKGGLHGYEGRHGSLQQCGR